MVSARINFWTQVTDSDSTSVPDSAIGEGKVMEVNIKGLLLSIPPIPTHQSQLCEGTALPAALFPLPNPFLFPA